MKLVIFRGGLKAMNKDLKMLRRRIHPKLGFPVSTNEQQSTFRTDEEGILKALAEDYMVNPGLYMKREDLKERLTEHDDSKLEELLQKLESEKLVKTHRDGNGKIVLIKATYKGLRKTVPLEKLKWHPDWLNEDHVF
jgi:hypothetical protein